jgi:molecular chaperone HtpG
MSRKGAIKVQTTDIFPIIKKWLYSEHDIFLRELISNACDAITKRATIARNENLEAPKGHVSVYIEPKDKVIEIRDNGIGMSEQEVEKYIANLAFSGAEEFIKNMKDSGQEANRDDIIGKFGLGFYSSFMVADKVEVESLSYKEGAKATKWTCAGDTEYEFGPSNKSEVGTTIRLYINEENVDFLQAFKTRQVIAQYCDFMPYPIQLIDEAEVLRIEEENAKAQKPEDKKPLPYDIVNDTQPLWKKDPSSITDDEYKGFYKKLFPMDGDPLFWLHLNVDHPFTLQGILYFPKFNPQKPINENSIRLYSKQVFVSDNVKNIVPEFLGLLKGAIDSSDIPLNVSRSALQGDPNIKKISNYIIKKVAESLKKLYKNDRERYESVWEDIALFVKYGVVSDEKFDSLMRDKVLFKNTEGKLMTFDEYQESIPADYKEKLKDKYITFEKGASDESLRAQLLAEGIQTIETENYIDPHFTQHCEFKKQGDKTIKFSPIDEEVENLLASDESENSEAIQSLFNKVFGLDAEKEEDKKDKFLEVQVKAIKNSPAAAYLKQDHQMKKFKQMTQQMGGPSPFDTPLKRTLVVNPNNALIKNALKLSEKGNSELVEKIAHHTLDLATISSQGLDEKQKQDFVTRSTSLIEELSSFAL